MVISEPSCLVNDNVNDQCSGYRGLTIIGIVTLLIGSTKLVKSGHIMNDFDPRDNREDVL